MYAWSALPKCLKLLSLLSQEVRGGKAYTSFPPLTETETEMVYGDQLGIFVSK